VIRVPFTKTTLRNGLDVIVHEDRRVPLVAVSVWYRVGSKNERPGLTGLAHLFEHLMFEGSAHQPGGYFAPLQEAGASLNGSTSADRTNYWELVPDSAARLALWMEADRMGWLLPAVTEERLETQRRVVLNERRQSYENRPYGLAQFAIMEALYPPGHPYHWPTIGYPRDLAQATLDDVRSFFARYYHPGNASLVVAGDIEADRTFAAVEEFFGDIPPGPPVPPVHAPPDVPAGARLLFEDRVELPRLYLAWRSPALFAPGDAELDLAADLIGNGRSSRLYRRLIHDRRIAAELAAGQSSRALSGTFQVIASAAPGHTLAELEAAIHEELDRFATEGPSADEVARNQARAESSFVQRLQSLGGFGGTADQLNAYNVFLGAPDSFETDLERYRSRTAADVRDAVGRTIDREAVALSVVPAGGRDMAAAGAVDVSWSVPA
jgi:zinc protease